MMRHSALVLLLFFLLLLSTTTLAFWKVAAKKTSDNSGGVESENNNSKDSKTLKVNNDENKDKVFAAEDITTGIGLVPAEEKDSYEYSELAARSNAEKHKNKTEDSSNTNSTSTITSRQNENKTLEELLNEPLGPHTVFYKDDPPEVKARKEAFFVEFVKDVMRKEGLLDENGNFLQQQSRVTYRDRRHEEHEEENFSCARHPYSSEYYYNPEDVYDFDYTAVELPEQDTRHLTVEEEFFSFLNQLNVDDWDVTLQQDENDGHYYLLFERDDVLQTVAVPEIFNMLSEDEMIRLAVDYFDQQDRLLEDTLQQTTLNHHTFVGTVDARQKQNKTEQKLNSKNLAEQRRRREAKILSVFFEKVGGSNVLEKDGRWLSNETVCNWYGIVCGHRGQHKAGMVTRREANDGSRVSVVQNPTPPPDDAVTAIQLNNLDFTGTIPTELAMLEFLSQLVLRNNKIKGTIPASLAYASRLCLLDLSNNRMTGSIPAILSAKTRFMYQIHLNNNNFNGTLPRNMRAWRKLWLMDYSYNSFSGSLPKQLRVMTDLAILMLGDNVFSGSLPTLPSSLQILDLGFNILSGEIPSSIGKLSNLLDLNLVSNLLSGTFPREILQIEGLHTVHLSYNNLTGTLPSSVKNWSNTHISVLDLSHNLMTGTLPRSLMVGTQSSLATLDLSYNRFRGTIPTEIGLLTSLMSINAMGNRLSGTLPTEMLNMDMNLRLNFSDNLLTGPIPKTFCGEGFPTNNILYREFGCDAVLCRPGTFNPHGHATLHSCCRRCKSTPDEEKRVLGRVSCPDLEFIHGDLDGDGIVSPREVLRMIYIDNIGTFWGPQYQTWVDLNVHECKLTGVTCNADKKIIKLDLSGANLCSSANRQPGPTQFCLGFPSEIGLLTDLEAFHSNRRQYVRGIIPTEIGRLTKLRLLDLSSCPSMKGTIPSEIGRLSNLKYLLLSHTPFTGTIPSSIFHLTDLEKLHLTKNNLKGTLPTIIRTTNLKEFMISRNKLNGTLPTQIGRLTALENFEAYGNHFKGRIPSELGKCQNLRRIDMFNNHFWGQIPSEIASIQKLQIFHFKSNHLTGTIPKEFADVPQLSWLDLSENFIRGTTPDTLGSVRTLKDLRLGDNRIYDPIPQALCESKSLNSGATQFGCSGVLCPRGTYGELGFAMASEGGCKRCPEGQTTLYLGSTKCHAYSRYEYLSWFFEVMGGETWSNEYTSTWRNASIPLCQWAGIKCDETGEIISMNLPVSIPTEMNNS